MSLPDLSHQSAPEARGEEHRDAEDGGPFYSCIHCGGQWITVRVPDSPCPDRVLAWGDEREAKGREEGRRALRSVMRQCLQERREHSEASPRDPQNLTFDDGASLAFSECAEWLSEALATLTGPEQP